MKVLVHLALVVAQRVVSRSSSKKLTFAQKTAQQSVQWTVGILRHFQALSTPERNLGLGVLSTPAPPPLTQAVGLPLT